MCLYFDLVFFKHSVLFLLSFHLSSCNESLWMSLYLLIIFFTEWLKWFKFFLFIFFLKLNLIFFNFTILYWFCHISTWIRHRYTRVPHPEPSSLPVPSLWVVPVHQPQASCILHWIWTGNSFLIWYYTCFNAFLPNHPPTPSPTESNRLFFTSVSLLLSHIQGCHYHLSKFHIYALVCCIGVFLSGLLHSV